MSLYKVIILAIIQGLTEFLPVSSTAHLAVAQNLFHWGFADPADDFAFDVALHLGTLLALIVYFFRDWLQIIAQGLGIEWGNDRQLKQNPQLLWLLALGSIPVGVAGLLFNKQAEGAWRNFYVIGAMLILLGLAMWLAEARATGRKELGDVTFADAGVIGVAQAIAVIPGASRSGVTITAGLFRDFDRPAAARFSFLLSTPAIAAAAAKSFYDLRKHHGGIPADMHVPFLVGILVSAIVGALVIAFLLDYLRRHSLRPFVYYRIIFGIIVIALALFRGNAG
jgi:undecaprenyl-diphosphatase